MRFIVMMSILVLTAVSARAQSFALQDSIAKEMQCIAGSSEDSVKYRAADRIVYYLKALPFSTYQSASPVKYLGYKVLPKPGVELFSWAFPVENGYAFYNLFKFGPDNRVYLLRSVSGMQEEVPPYLFYDLLPFKSRGETYFVLLGWGSGRKTNQKAIVIARFAPQGSVEFNHRLLKKGNSRSALMTFEYGKGMSMMLKPHSNGKRIIFDHLSAGDEKYEGFYSMYGPDGTYDAFKLKAGEWIYEEDVKLKLRNK